MPVDGPAYHVAVENCTLVLPSRPDLYREHVSLPAGPERPPVTHVAVHVTVHLSRDHPPKSVPGTRRARQCRGQKRTWSMDNALRRPRSIGGSACSNMSRGLLAGSGSTLSAKSVPDMA
eukprot:2426972-Rhodomonas_salina.1